MSARDNPFWLLDYARTREDELRDRIAEGAKKNVRTISGFWTQEMVDAKIAKLELERKAMIQSLSTPFIYCPNNAQIPMTTAQVSKPQTALEKFLSDSNHREHLVLKALKGYRDGISNGFLSLSHWYDTKVELVPACGDVWYSCLSLTGTFESPITGSQNFPVHLALEEYMVLAIEDADAKLAVELYAHRSMDMSVLDELIKRLELKLNFNSYMETEPVANTSRVLEPVCECGGSKSNTTHSDWCPLFNP